ncbi:Protein kinase-like domain protein [Niveomyces insectorum RCEF 264]|uniref:EKC/KEOPS complex subunit BUD32 n=1 Tax=Niveomyces insectorum RCEF 264 TaxID=1081102 RepID=A0A162KBV6_9HYPO|nr:Protein kinase-like domain protein [Niveomyces insectorum RCEF 264]
MAEAKRIQELEELLQKLQFDNEEARKNAAEANERAVEARKNAAEAQKAADEAKQRAATAEERTRPTTLDEYIAACHALVFSKFAVETDPRFTSKGGITNPRNKWCPTNLRPWSGFIDEQRATFGSLYEALPAEMHAFESRSFLEGLGTRMARFSIADEKTLEYFLHSTVEDPVRAILEQLKEVDKVKRRFGLGGGILFENHPHAISDVSEEVVAQGSPSTPPATPGQELDLNQLRPDQICVYRFDVGGVDARTMIYICEYKPPHKLTAPHLRLGLRPMDIYADVVNRKTIPTEADKDARFQYHAERLTASAITQTYHYMIEGGLEYGLLTTGELIVFLKIDWDEPETLLFHLAEPSAEVAAADPHHAHMCTAVGQYLAFSLLALGIPGERRLHRQDERDKATQNLRTWAEDFQTTLQMIPHDERQAPDSSPGYQPVAYEGIDRSPYVLRRKARKPVQDEPVRENTRRDAEDSSDGDSGPNLPDTPSPAERRPGRGGRGAQGHGQGTRRSQRIQAQRPRGGGEKEAQEEDIKEGRQGDAAPREMPYCTQKCLLGLVKGGSLDPSCPNVTLHKKHSCGGPSVRTSQKTTSTARHPIKHAQFLDLLWQQLRRTLDDGITPLPYGGARGVLFRVTLLGYGYTFVSKGTVRAFVPDLEHEAAVYRWLQPIQGVHVPVFLGAIDLRPMNRIYYFDHRVYIIHMTFLSWGGDKFDPAAADTEAKRQQLRTQAKRSLLAIHKAGVVHRDVRALNMLVNAEINGVMVIDFERARILKPPRRPLAQVAPNKRRPTQEEAHAYAGKLVARSSRDDRALKEDLGEMEMMFYDPNRYTSMSRA